MGETNRREEKAEEKRQQKRREDRREGRRERMGAGRWALWVPLRPDRTEQSSGVQTIWPGGSGTSLDRHRRDRWTGGDSASTAPPPPEDHWALVWMLQRLHPADDETFLHNLLRVSPVSVLQTQEKSRQTMQSIDTPKYIVTTQPTMIQIVNLAGTGQ